jgi:hypothetical protein
VPAPASCPTFPTTPMTDRRIGLVLDTSAVRAFGQGSVHVGGPLAELADEKAAFAVPSLCMVYAWRAAPAGERDRVRLLARNPGFVPVASPPADWWQVSRWAALLGAVDLAEAALALVAHDSVLLCADPVPYDKAGIDADRIITLGDW